MPSVRGNVQTLLTSGALTTSGAQTAINLSTLLGGEPDSAQFLLNVKTVSGTTPTVDVFLQWSTDQGTTWWDFVHFTQATTTGIQAALWTRRDNDGTGGTGVITTGNAVLAAGKVLNAPISTSSFRVKWTLGGTITEVDFVLLACMDRD